MSKDWSSLKMNKMANTIHEVKMILTNRNVREMTLTEHSPTAMISKDFIKLVHATIIFLLTFKASVWVIQVTNQFYEFYVEIKINAIGKEHELSAMSVALSSSFIVLVAFVAHINLAIDLYFQYLNVYDKCTSCCVVYLMVFVIASYLNLTMIPRHQLTFPC